MLFSFFLFLFSFLFFSFLFWTLVGGSVEKKERLAKDLEI